MPHRRFINCSTFHFEANKMVFYCTSSHSSFTHNPPHFYYFYLLNVQSLAMQIYHPFVHTPLHPRVWSKSRVLKIVFLLHSRKEWNQKHDMIIIKLHVSDWLVLLVARNQKLLAYANHLKGHSQWQRFVAPCFNNGNLKWLETKMCNRFVQTSFKFICFCFKLAKPKC